MKWPSDFEPKNILNSQPAMPQAEARAESSEKVSKPLNPSWLMNYKFNLRIKKGPSTK